MVDTTPLHDQPIPHSKGLPLVGDTLKFIQSPHHYIQSQQQRHSSSSSVSQCPIFSSSLLNQKVHIACSEPIRQLIQQHTTQYTHSKAYELIGFQRFYGQTLLTSDDPQYVQQVKALFEGAFSRQCITEYVVPTVTQFCSTEIRAAVQQIADSHQPTPLYATIKDLLPSLIFTLLFSSNFNTADDDLQHMLDSNTLHAWSKQTFQGSIGLPIKWLPLNIKSSYAQGQHAKQEFQQWVSERIAARLPYISQLNESDQPTTFFDRLLLQIDHMSQDRPNIEQQLVDIVVAHLSLFISALISKALSSIITTTMEQLFASDDTQQYVEQIRSEVGSADVNSMSYEQLQQMHTLNNVMKEVERMFPPILGVPRYSQVNTAPLVHENTQHTIPDNSHVWISYYSAGRDEACYTNVHTFDPSRWKVDSTEHGHHLAFGDGSRSCLGRAFSLVIAKSVVLQMVTAADWQTIADDNRKYKYIPVYRAVNDLHVTCRPLTSEH